MTKPQHSLSEMAILMAQTFEVRRQDVLENNFSVKNALDIYPGLRDFQELRREFERITGQNVNDFERHLNCVLKQYAEEQSVLEFSDCTNAYCKEALEILREKDGEDNARITAARVILFGCAQSQKKWLDVVFQVIGEDGKKIKRPQPTVLVRGTPFGKKCADVYCERIKIVGGLDFHGAIFTCYFLYYILNISLPPVDADVYRCFDRVNNLMAEDEGGATPSVTSVTIETDTE